MKNAIFVFVLVLLGFFFRFVGLQWDQGTFLHPDERFLVMVTQEVAFPDSRSFFEFLNHYFSADSPLRVENTSHSFYVYGTFPVVLLKGLSLLLLSEENFTTLTLLGRYISLFLEMGVLIGVFFLARYFTKHLSLPSQTPLWAVFLYASMVLPIQLSHFFTVDPFVTFFCLWALIFFTFSEKKHTLWWIILGSISYGLALSSKISAVFFSPLLVAFLFSKAFFSSISVQKPETSYMSLLRKKLWYFFLYTFIFGIFTYISVRIANPEYFASLNWHNPLPSPHFLQNLYTLKDWSKPDTWFPPSVQWLERTPVLFSLTNLVFFGVGLWPSLAFVIGMVWVLLRQTKTFLAVTVLWVCGFFLWQSTQFVQTLRYFYFLYPFLAVFAALAVSLLQQSVPQKKSFFVTLIFIVLTLIWPLMFLNIFFSSHTRVQATLWMREHIPAQSRILYEYWDDSLPLLYVPGNQPSYDLQALSVFDEDSPQKWATLRTLLQSADYYTLTSNRAWASISRVPEKYPATSRFYDSLFSGNEGYTLVQMFQSKPSLEWLGIPFSLDDSWAEEAFTVYDHPTVYIFQNTGSKIQED